MPRQASHCPSVHLFAAALLAAFTLSATSVSADTFRVVTTSDEAPSSAVCDSVEAPGPNACSLRTAINAANLSPEIDTIDFALTAEDQNADGLYVIELDDELPAFKAPVILDATTQAGYAGRPVVALDAGPLLVSWGIYLSEGLSSDPGAHGSEVRGLAIYGATSYAIHLDRVDGCLVADNHVGLDLANVAVGNRNTGVRIFAGSGNTLRRNVIVASGGLGVDVRSQSGNPALDNALLDNVLGASAPLPAGIDDPPRVLAGNDIGLGVFGDGTLVEGNTAVATWWASRSWPAAWWWSTTTSAPTPPARRASATCTMAWR